MRIGHKEQKVLRYIAAPFVIVCLGLAIYITAGSKIVALIASDVQYVVTQGKPYEVRVEEGNITFSEKSEGVISNGEWKSPSVGEQYGAVRCDNVGLNVPLYYGDTMDVLLKGAGQSLGSVFPGEEGTVLIGAHDTTYFKELENVRVSDRITLQTTYGLFEYEVNDITIVEGSEFALDSAEELLVLYTCYPYGDVANERNQKIIYTCTKVSGPLLGGGANE